VLPLHDDFLEKRRVPVGIFGRLTRVIKILIIVNVVVFFINALLDDRLTPLLGLTPPEATLGLKLWQFVTYLFIHGNLTHLFVNMIALWMFGGPVEEAMGSRRFAGYYLLCGVGAGICACIFSWHTPSIGASGAVYGILAAFGMLFPEATVLVFFIIPMKARYFVLLFAGIELATEVATVTPFYKDNIAHFAHLGGMLTGYLYMKYHYQLEALYKTAQVHRKIKNYKEDRVQEKTGTQEKGVVQEKSEKQNQKLEQDDLLNKQVDMILDKIRRDGIESLSKQDQEMLNQASERLRERDEKVVDINQYRDRLR
jgi:membrane associated rhomboid family serine protease